MTRISDAPGVELARAKAALRRASSAWDEVLKGFAEEGVAEAVEPLSPRPEAEAEEDTPADSPARAKLLAERREALAQQMRKAWPEGKPRRRWWPKG